jgi:hypothetical protein
MKWLLLCAALAIVVSSWAPVQAQTTDRPTHFPTQQNQNGPFGTEWAKPPGTTGSYIYNDPRRRDPNSAYKTQRAKPCPAPAVSDPVSGGCR